MIQRLKLDRRDRIFVVIICDRPRSLFIPTTAKIIQTTSRHCLNPLPHTFVYQSPLRRQASNCLNCVTAKPQCAFCLDTNTLGTKGLDPSHKRWVAWHQASKFSRGYCVPQAQSTVCQYGATSELTKYHQAVVYILLHDLKEALQRCPSACSFSSSPSRCMLQESRASMSITFCQPCLAILRQIRAKPRKGRGQHHRTLKDLCDAANDGCHVCKRLRRRFLRSGETDPAVLRSRGGEYFYEDNHSPTTESQPTGKSHRRKNVIYFEISSPYKGQRRHLVPLEIVAIPPFDGTAF